ncbi:peptidyl-prolyl cis-trans isomerase FKBP11 isoform X2 [Salminus brasiliensis]|uniref:peptidyl-prolyl cis-trans isomerase FKBP11 isoform X2 n=1 Tax=Salminus brasiliensis TaxID=930266 RepID=UPI003B834D9A
MKFWRGFLIVVLAAFSLAATEDAETEASVDELMVETVGRLLDGKVIDSSLSREPLVVELGKRTVISGLEQALIGVCEGQKIKATIPAHLAYGKRGYPPTIPGDSALEFEVEVISLLQQTPWQKLVNDVFPIMCLALVPTLLGLVGLYLYNKANTQPHGKKKNKDKKSKKK